jgi:hypothetical protein
MGKTIQFNRPDGKTCPGYMATAKEDASLPGFPIRSSTEMVAALCYNPLAFAQIGEGG